MWHNYLTAALRNLLRNRAYTGINLVGLALGFAATILIALYVRDEYSFEHFFPGFERIYQVSEYVEPPGGIPLRISVTAADIVPAMKLNFPDIDQATRLVPTAARLRHGDIQGSVKGAYWAEPNFFELFPAKAIAGDLRDALNQPDGLVLTRSVARRFFGREAVVGETIELDGQHVMRVAAVVEDLPANTHFNWEMLLPAVASFSGLNGLEADLRRPDSLRAENVYGYVRLRPGTGLERINAGMRAFVTRHVPGVNNGVPIADAYSFILTPIAEVHFQPPSLGAMKVSSDPRTLHILSGVGLLILVMAGGNFVSMMTARAARRAVEVGVRKAVGATRHQVMVQFVGECLFYTLLALLLAVLLVRTLLPAFNGFLHRDIALDFLMDPLLGVGIIGVAIVTGLAAGAYPALVLSRFKPSEVLKGTGVVLGGSNRVRQALVVFQFGVLVVLLVTTLTVHRQTQFALQERLRVPTDQIYVAHLPRACPRAFMDSLRQSSGVLAASCLSSSALMYSRTSLVFTTPTGSTVAVKAAPVDVAFFDLFGIKPVAGRLFSTARGGDSVQSLNGMADTAGARERNPTLVINESAARALGFAPPSAAVGQFRRWARIGTMNGQPGVTAPTSSEIVGVVPDFSLGSVRDEIEPTGYYVDSDALYYVALRLGGRAVPEALNAVEELWSRQGAAQPLEGKFLSQYMNELYGDILRQSAIFSAFAGVAVVIASLGLLGLAVFTAERRTKEIGLRKVMGASRADILRFVSWQFTWPVLWANLLGWPCAYLLMRRWLEGFAYHVEQSLWVFVAVGGFALVVALAAVGSHALLISRAKPIEALRYE